MKFSSASLQIWYIDSLYHANQLQYVGNYMLIYFIIFCIFECFFNIQKIVLER